MNLREPKRKLKTKVQPQSPLPITTNTINEWTIYTAYLTDLGSCVANVDEISAVHSMGFFGKGSLSRSYPSFGKARYGAPPIIKNRQWIHRQTWLEEVKQINEESIQDHDKDATSNIVASNELYNQEDIHNSCINTKEKTDFTNNKVSNENKMQSLENHEINSELDITEIRTNVIIHNNKDTKTNIQIEKEVDEVILDSTEEDDVCVIVSREIEKLNNEKSSKKNEETNMKIIESELYNLDDCNMLEDNSTSLQGKLLVLPDSDSDTEDYLKQIKPKIEYEGFPVRETLHLTFEETFFLMFGLGCLQLINFDNSILDINSAWLYFCKKDKSFVQKYIVYHYFRSKGWVVKPGLKYGGDFLLYKQGPPFFHASYIVIIDVVDADLSIRNSAKSMRKLTWNNLFSLDRLSETAAKEILFAQVLWPSSIPQNSNPSSPDMLSQFTVKELLWRRWKPQQNRDIIILEDEDQDSC